MGGVFQWARRLILGGDATKTDTKRMSGLFIQDEDSDEELLQLELSRQDQQITESAVKGVEGERDQEEIADSSEDEAPLYPLIPIDTDKGNDLKPNIDDIRPVDIQLSVELPFQQQIIENCLVSDDPLVIMGKGLGVAGIVANLLHILSTPTKINGESKRSLVIVLNATDNDNKQLREWMQELSWLDMDHDDQGDSAESSRPFHVVTSESLTVEKRRELYQQGGVASVTSRILIVDLLSGVLHPNKVTGMVVLNVDMLKTYSNESFILEIYRSQNKWGFIKGFSEAPESFTMEFSPLLKRMKELRFQNVLLWPRFRVEISSVLNKTSQANKVIEVKVSLTNSMSQIQFGLMECLNKCIGELNRKNPSLARDWWTLEGSLDPNFLRSVNAVMMPNWHRISYESKQLVKDIRYLAMLMKSLLTSDSVDFYEEVQASLDANKPSISRKYTESPWLMAEESQLVISFTRKRVFYQEGYVLEEMPKWEQLMGILDDISQERLSRDRPGPTLIVCSDDNTVAQLSRLLKMGNRKQGLRRLMLAKLQYYKERREERKRIMNEVKDKNTHQSELDVSTTFAKDQVVSKRRRTRGAAVVAEVQRLKTAGAGEDIEGAIGTYDVNEELSKIDGDDDGQESDIELLDDELVAEDQDNVLHDHEVVTIDDNMDDDDYDFILPDKEVEERPTVTEEIWNHRIESLEYISNEDQVVIEKFSNIDDDTLLQEIKPSYIIMYEPDLTFIRRVEIYRSIQNYDLKVYFMYYAESVEEQRHLLAIKKEKDAFSKLIKENSQLSHHFETTEDISHFKNLAERKIKMNKLNNRNTRNAGGQNKMQHFTQDIVIVDTREFNASLPGLLFRYGVRVVPVMLSVGDYIISPDICLERKAISDLIASLQNNRLVSQCKKMLQYYKYAVLLIEFDEDQSFSLEPFSERKNYRKMNLSTTHPISSKLSQDEIQMKLAKLVMKFPTLKLIWSSSPLQTVNIILELKLGREQPDPNVASSYGTHLRKGAKQKSRGLVQTENDNIQKFSKLLSIEGLSKIDYFNIRKKVKRYDKLTKLNVDDIKNIVGDVSLAQKISNFIQEQAELEELSDVDM